MVDTVSGTLKFSSEYEDKLVEIAQENIKEINYYTNFADEFISSSTNINNILNNSTSSTWNVTVKSPFPITESIFNREEFKNYRNGVSPVPSAQIAVEIIFNKYIKASRLRISPNISNGLYLIQVIAETGISDGNNVSSESQKNSMISNPIFINKTTDVDFIGTFYIKSLTLILGQSDYVRTKITPLQSELNSKMINEISKAVREDRKKRHDTLQDLVIKFFIKDYAKDFILRNKRLYNYDYTYYYPTDFSKKNVGVIKEIKDGVYYSDVDSLNRFKNTTLLSNIVFSIVSYTVGSNLRSMVKNTYLESNLKSTSRNIRSYDSGGIVPLGDSNNISENIHFLEETFSPVSQADVTSLMANVEKQNQYEYMFSLKNISVFESSVGQTVSDTMYKIPNRSVFVSKRLELNGTPLKAKMMADYFIEAILKNYDESLDKTSIEFSVSVKDNPISESDWIPILPQNVGSVRSEVLFPNTKGESLLRFIPNRETIRVYENSIKKSYDKYLINGKFVTILDYDPTKRYRVSYVPENIKQAREIDLFARSSYSPLLQTVSSNGFNGERFTRTGLNDSVDLMHNPYVDNDKYLDAEYSSRRGTLATSNSTIGNFDYSSYSPVKVILDDGTVAINLTNYLLNDFQVPSFYETDLLLFIHSGKTLIFNKEITQPFRVLYHHVADVFRYRVVLRNLDNTVENYSVDRLIFKFSVSKNDTIVNSFIKYDNRYKNRII